MSNVRFNKFESVADMFAFIRRHGTQNYRDGRGNIAENIMRYIERGATPEEIAPVERMMGQIDATVQDRAQREYVAGVAGAFPIVPDYLQGMPLHMRRRQHVASEVAPVRLVMECSVSGGFNAEAFAKRGAAMAALAMRMSETRPTEMYLAWGDKVNRFNTIGMVKVNMQPASLSEITALVCHMGFQYAVTFATDYAQAGTRGGIKWAWGMEPGDSERIERIRKVMGLEPGDIFIPGGYTTEAMEMVRDPVAWVNKYLDAQRTMDEEI